ncbi:MAG: Hsp33 family molecular chaperone HslO [Pseudomonadales bacterium]
MSDHLQRFHFQDHAVRGALVRLDDTLAELQRRRAYPERIASMLGEMLAAVAMIADGLKWPGSVALQSKGSGLIRTTLAEHRPEGMLRAIARGADEETPLPQIEDSRLAQLTAGDLIGGDQLALSLIPPDDDNRNQPYQGLIGWHHDTLAANLVEYFAISEQLETRFELYSNGNQARGLLLQRLPNASDASFITEQNADDFWTELSLRMQTLQPGELIAESDPALLRNLFAPQNLILAPTRALAFQCTCNQEKTENILRTLGKPDLLDLLEERGEISVTCEFCGLDYTFDHLATHLLFTPEPETRH